MDAAEVYLAKPAPDEIEAQLLRPINAVVGTLNPEGTIHLAFVIFLWHQGRFYFETASMTKKVRNIRNDPTASFAIDPPGFMAMAEGVARIIEGEEAHRLNRMLRAKNLTEEAAGTVGEAWGEFDDVSVEITPLKWRSWSSGKLVEASKEAAGDLPADQWFVPED
jgi:nitroimidazol reductase NimA-like FMN-containing flavoprotein (pyridoxamine 5'-phosphate oxidase superfamily)